MRRLSAGLVIATATGLVLTGCARRTTGGAVRAGVSVAASTTSPSLPVEPEPALQGTALAAPYSYDYGSTRFDPPEASYVPQVSASAALKAFDDTSLYANELVGKSPQVFLASYTSYERSTGVSPNGELQPDTYQRPVWIIRYTDVPDIASGPGHPAGVSSAPQPIVLHDMVAIVYADTGVVREVISGLPDQTAQGAPRAGPGT